MQKFLINFSFILMIFCLCACGVPIKIKHSMKDDCLIFDIQKWGEYMTMIDLIEIIDMQKNKVIWSAQPKPGKFARIAYLKLCKGINPVFPPMTGDVQALQCASFNNNDSFILKNGRNYQLIIISPEHNKPGKAIFSFTE